MYLRILHFSILWKQERRRDSEVFIGLFCLFVFVHVVVTFRTTFVSFCVLVLWLHRRETRLWRPAEPQSRNILSTCTCFLFLFYIIMILYYDTSSQHPLCFVFSPTSQQDFDWSFNTGFFFLACDWPARPSFPSVVVLPDSSSCMWTRWFLNSDSVYKNVCFVLFFFNMMPT